MDMLTRELVEAWLRDTDGAGGSLCTNSANMAAPNNRIMRLATQLLATMDALTTAELSSRIHAARGEAALAVLSRPYTRLYTTTEKNVEAAAILRGERDDESGCPSGCPGPCVIGCTGDAYANRSQFEG
jgi:hypothetical protein